MINQSTAEECHPADSVSHDLEKSRPTGFLLARREFTFATDDPRIRNRENVTLFVVNANTTSDAKRMVRKFLADVETHGLRID